MINALNGLPASRVAIITGGSRGVGGATARRLAARGYVVVVNYLHDQRAAEAIVEAILTGNGDAMAVRADVADDLDVQRLFAETITTFGGVDVVVHTAGRQLVRLNTRAAFVVNQQAARHLRSGGAIVNLSSSVITNMLTQALALELRERDITVNAVSPGINRPCVPDRVADVIAYLLSDPGHRITGQVLRVPLAEAPGKAL